jgi:hypothetical protein
MPSGTNRSPSTLEVTCGHLSANTLEFSMHNRGLRLSERTHMYSKSLNSILSLLDNN